jgi:hypothetical protein
MKTIYDLAIWHHAVDGETYAFPIGAKDVWGDVIYPKLNSAEWDYKGTLPKGMPITNVKVVQGHRVKVTIAGANGINTADWAYVE